MDFPSEEDIETIAHDVGESTEDVEEIFELYSQGFRNSEISEIMGLLLTSVDWVLESEGLDPFNNDY